VSSRPQSSLDSPEPYRTLVYVLGVRGLRIGEAAGLCVADVDLMRGRLTISRTLSEVEGRLLEGEPKTQAGVRTLTLPPFLRDLLVDHLARFSDPTDPTARVFTGPSNGPLRPSAYRKRVFAPAVAAAGLDPKLTPHDLRDTSATIAFASGATVKQVQRMLGHAKSSITLDRYTGVLESMEARTDERLDAAFRELKPMPAGDVVSLG
jgi:integrase